MSNEQQEQQQNTRNNDGEMTETPQALSSSSSTTTAASNRRKVAVHQFQQNLLSLGAAGRNAGMGVPRPDVDVPGFVEPALGGYAHLVWESSTSNNNNNNKDDVVAGNIYLGSAEAAMEGITPFFKLEQANIGGIVNCTKDIPCRYRDKGARYAQVAINDVPGADLLTYLPGATAFIHACLGDWNKSVLVRCMAGISRSSSVVLAYLMEYQAMTLEQAYSHVKQRRPQIDPNDGFWAQLMLYEKRCRSRWSSVARPEIMTTTTATKTNEDEQQHEENNNAGGAVVKGGPSRTKPSTVINQDWAKRSSATYATCRELPLPGDTLEQACFGQLVDTLSDDEKDRDEEIDSVLNVALDWLWGRGVLPVEVDWLVQLCRVLDEQRGEAVPPRRDAADRVHRILSDPNSPFLSDWVGEVYPAQLNRVFVALGLSPPSQTAS